MPVRLAAAAALLLAPPAAAAGAPVLTPLKPCYDTTSRVTVEGRGFTPDALVDIAVDGEPAFSGVQIDAKGRLKAMRIPAPDVDSGQQAFRIAVTEQAHRKRRAVRRSLVTVRTVTVTPRRATPSTRVRFRGRGFVVGRPVFAHYVRKGKARRTVRLIRATGGKCGTFSARRRQFPFRPKVGRWTL